MADEEKTESASGKRRQELRNKGQVARSPEVMTAFVLASGLLGLWVGAANLYAELGMLAERYLGRAAQTTITQDSFVLLVIDSLGALVRGTAPMFIAGILGGIVGNLVQVGFMVSWESLTPDYSRLNPIPGLMNLFKKTKFVDLFKNILKVIVVAWVCYVGLRDQVGEFPHTSALPPRALLIYMLDLGFEILKDVLIVYIVLALLDFAFQKWQWEEQNKMSKQELKDEFKQTEGDPMIRGRIRSLQREMARRRMMAEVPKSDVVVTNPTHFAVALRYRPGEAHAPEVTAKGADLVARRIIDLARESGVPVYESPPLARTLYRQVEIGEAIPFDLFRAVAEILAQVYRLSGGQRPA